MSVPNGVMMQVFHWYSSADGTLWRDLAASAPELAASGVTSVWLPPASKAAGGPDDVGYAAYDLFDLGEFDQKGSVRTKYGTKDELIAACSALKEAGVRIYADAVFNHRLGADAEEDVLATRFAVTDRTTALGDPETIRAWTHFTFPGRGGQYSAMQWHWQHFTAIDQADDQGTPFIYLHDGKQFDSRVDGEHGNYDFLMGCDVDTSHPDVRADLEAWGEWFVHTTGVSGFRFDAAKHIDADFFREWIVAVSARTEQELFAVGEFWSYDVETLEEFLGVTEERILLFDAPLHDRFRLASVEGVGFDLRTIFDDTLVHRRPQSAVTFVENHDSQPLQSLESVVEPWFKPLAYAIILLRRDGYPCIFSADYYGAQYEDVGNDGERHAINMPSHRFLIDHFLSVRVWFAFGEQCDYFDSATMMGWSRLGDDAHPGGVAVLLSIAGDSQLWMNVAQPDTEYRDVTNHISEIIRTNQDGWAEFRCMSRSVSVWIPATAWPADE
jgi:alpha-amylase